MGTGIAVEIPPGFEGEVRLRSSLGAMGFCIPNGVGTIDSDYRGEIRVILSNEGRENLKIQAGDRVAQLVLGPVAQIKVQVVAELSETTRGEGGLGWTGK